MRYELIIKPSAEKTLDRLPRAGRQRLVEAMQRLCEQPRPPGVVKLSGDEGTYRIRVGDYRIVYEIEDDQLIVFVLYIGHRKDAYRGK